MNFYPKDMNVKGLFKLYGCFKIPVFQRDYSWDEPYYRKFLDDIIGRLEIVDGKLTQTPYFIGTMVFVGPVDGGTVDVVDGQQRITFITILFSVLSQIFKTIEEEELSKAIFKYVKEKDDEGTPARHLISDTSYPYFECFIQSADKKYADEPKSEEEENLKETYDYLLERLGEGRLRQTLQNADAISYVDILKAIRDQILSSMVVAIRTPEKKSAFMIYEILNAKGKNLASIDLIKNIIFEKMHGDANGATGIAEDTWESIKQILRDRDNSIGFATFYRHYWISKYKKVTNMVLYDSFKEQITPKTIDRYIEFLKEMKAEAEQYIKIISPLTKDYDDRKEYFWLVQSLKTLNNTFNIVQSRIALLALLDLKSRDLISSKKLKDTVLYLENFVFAYMIIGSKRTNIFESTFSKFAIEARKSDSKSKTNQIIKEFLEDKLDSHFITYDIFEDNFVNLSFSKGNSPQNIISKYVMNKIASYYDNREVFFDDSSIEHIISEEDEITKNIGNLICLEENLNREAGDLSYEEKREIYLKSKYQVVDVHIKEYEEFTIEDISTRAKGLAEIYYTKILKRTI